MKLKLLSTAAAATLFVAGTAFAQDTPDFASEQEATMYQNNTFMSGFFTDDTMSEMRSDEEMRTAYDGLEDADRESLKTACENVKQNRGSYGTMTLDVCTKVESM